MIEKDYSLITSPMLQSFPQGTAATFFILYFNKFVTAGAEAKGLGFLHLYLVIPMVHLQENVLADLYSPVRRSGIRQGGGLLQDVRRGLFHSDYII